MSELLRKVIGEFKKDRKYYNTITLEGSLMASLEYSTLEKMPFFKRIAELSKLSN